MSGKHSVVSREALQIYRSAFHFVFVDEDIMVSSDILQKVCLRLQKITNEFEIPFGGMKIVFCGDLRLLLPVNARPVFRPHWDSLSGAAL
jgi:hypothetical protein